MSSADVVVFIPVYLEVTTEFRGWKYTRLHEGAEARNAEDMHTIIACVASELSGPMSRLRSMQRREFKVFVQAYESDAGGCSGIADIREQAAQCMNANKMAFGISPPSYPCPKCDRVHQRDVHVVFSLHKTQMYCSGVCCVRLRCLASAHGTLFTNVCAVNAI